jgi:hypothetical protein
MTRFAIFPAGVLAVLIALAATSVAQTPAAAPKAVPANAMPIKAMPIKAKTPSKSVKIDSAIVMKVVGTAQARNNPKAGWRKLKFNDVLPPGVVIRTGRKSMVALRVGRNATMLIDRQSRVSIPKIIRDGDKLQTRVSLQWGRTEIKVNKVGRVNDFEVATPSATLAVRGTAFRISWDVVHGMRTQGVSSNRIHAIQLAYLHKVNAALSKADSSSERFPLPALDAWYVTYIEPLIGAFSPEEIESERLRPVDTENPLMDSGLAAANQTRGNKASAQGK